MKHKKVLIVFMMRFINKSSTDKIDKGKSNLKVILIKWKKALLNLYFFFDRKFTNWKCWIIIISEDFFQFWTFLEWSWFRYGVNIFTDILHWRGWDLQHQCRLLDFVMSSGWWCVYSRYRLRIRSHIRLLWLPKKKKLAFDRYIYGVLH